LDGQTATATAAATAATTAATTTAAAEATAVTCLVMKNSDVKEINHAGEGHKSRTQLASQL
jgi:hypothetical protein